MTSVVVERKGGGYERLGRNDWVGSLKNKKGPNYLNHSLTAGGSNPGQKTGVI